MRPSRRRCLDGARRAFVPGLLSVLVALAVLLGSTGCAGSGASAGELTVAGSTTVMPIAEIAAEQFTEHTGIHVLVSGLGSSAGIESVLNGTADIATSSRDLTEAEKSTGELVTTEVATDGIAVIVNTQNRVANVTMDQLRAIYAGQITNWKELGGEDLPILVVNRDEASGTREAFKTIVMGDTRFDPAAAVLPGTGQVRDVVSRTPGAIGYISLGFVDSAFTSAKVKALAVNSVEPSEAAVEAGAYPVSRYLYFFTKGEPSGTAKEYIALVVSDEMAQTIRDAGYIPISAERKGGE
ncbi:phosphate ABC transporter substrate-binding protein [Muricaecibacterium torontonense]|uniref:phosphate ABC transporter substrate-binding protein n=1 Tax=Muricaecibacterium torontonense TaxID=3032871 RepID=UPI0023B81DB7|nr:phosphate ABC transporter substrate-binding protein [Muricaecibacterium torontonense]